MAKLPKAWSQQAPTIGQTMSKRLSVNLPDKTAAQLADIANWREVTVTRAVRDAITNEHLMRCAFADGYEIFLKDPDGNIKQIVFVT